MTDTDRMFEDAVAGGLRNRDIIDLARRHCLNMEFPEWVGGGFGMVEAATGLPIGSRRVRCPYETKAGGASSNLEWIASDFYVDNCVGCPHRRPTGEVPNLSTLVESQLKEREHAAETDRQALQRRRDTWKSRMEVRRDLRATGDPTTVSAIDDLEVIDHDPTEKGDDEQAALRRLNALAVQAPEAFPNDVVNHALDLVENAGLTALLRPLRQLASSRPDIRERLVGVAVRQLRSAPDVDAASCLVDFADLLDANRLDRDVVRSLVALAGQPSLDAFGRRATRSPEPAGLRVAATLVPDRVIEVIANHVRPAPRETSLVVPPGVRGRHAPTEPTDLERSTAAGAVRALASSHPKVAQAVATALIRSLRDPDDDAYGIHPTSDLQRTIASLVVRGILDIARLGEAAVHASGDYRERLFGVLTRIRWIADPNDRFPEPDDPVVDANARAALHSLLVEECLARLSGDWGQDVAFHAADLLEDLAGDDPARVAPHLSALLGAFLELVDRVHRRPLHRIEAVTPTSPELAGMEEYSRQQTWHAAAHRVLRAVEAVASVNMLETLAAIEAVLQDERARGPSIELRWRLLPLVGDIGRRHGDSPGTLRRVLTILHTYLVDADPVLRAAALKAWVEIASRHEVPSSLHDLLPVLAEDRYLAVVQELVVAARRLDWEPADEAVLLRHALAVADWAAMDAAQHKDLLKEALFTIRRLASRCEPATRDGLELLVIDHARGLYRYDLRDLLRGSWSAFAARSPQMASLRLRLARDPAINDRVNARDYDAELTDLLDCGAGLNNLPTEDLTSAALAFAPDHPLASAEFMEVAWRAARPGDAEAIMAAVLDHTPDQPALIRQRSVADCFRTAAAVDVAAMRRPEEMTGAARVAADAAQRLDELHDEDDDYARRLLRQIRIRLALRAALAGIESESVGRLDVAGVEGTVDPAGARRTRADALDEVGRLLADGAKELTATGSYLRGFAEATMVGSHLLRADAAELDGDVDGCRAHRTAASRRAAEAAARLLESFGTGDPLVGPLVESLEAAVESSATDGVWSFLSALAAMPMPLLVVEGPRGRRRAHAARVEEAVAAPVSTRPVAVVLASIDDHVVTGPQVLRPATVHRLRLNAAVDEWPEWATSLDATFVSHMTSDEAETPAFTWRKPTEGNSVEGEGTLVLRFGLPAGQPAPPFLLTLRFRGEKDGSPATERCDVAGHRELRLRPFDASRDSLTQHPVLDERLLKLYEQLHGAGYDESQVQAFCRLLTAICRVGFTMTWEKRYKKGARVLERDFHDDLFARLKAEPELGGRVERGSPSALGYLDVRHDGITAELKVERATAVTRESAPKYMGQPTQYAAADGARLSILCVLDMSPKESPVGTPENYIFTLQPALHGVTNPEAPSIVTTVIVNGNLPSPSSWSRRKVSTQADDTNDETTD